MFLFHRWDIFSSQEWIYNVWELNHFFLSCCAELVLGVIHQNSDVGSICSGVEGIRSLPHRNCFFLLANMADRLTWCQRGILIFFPMARVAPAVFFIVYRIYIWESGVAWFPSGNHLGCPDSSGLSLSRQRTTYSSLEAAQGNFVGNSGDLWPIRGTYDSRYQL